MPKRGQQHHHDDHGTGHNNPDKTVEITTGTYKKPSTYKKQAAMHEDTGKSGQHSKVAPHEQHDLEITLEADSQRREERGATRSGSESNA